MKVAVVMRSFLDYRIPVFRELDILLGGNLWVLYSADSTPERVILSLEKELGQRAIKFSGEWSSGYDGNITTELANTRIRVPYQPGLIKNLRQIKPDVVIGDGFFQWTWMAIFYSILFRSKLVLCYERTSHTERNAQWYRTAFRVLVSKFVDGMAVNGRLTQEYVQTLGVPLEVLTTGQMVADTQGLLDSSSNLSLESLKKKQQLCDTESKSEFFLIVSQLIERKGILYLLRAWKSIGALEVTNRVLLIIGDGPEKKSLQEFVLENSLDNVRFMGSVNHADMYRYYAIASWFLIPTLEDNWSLVVPEAMACGLPILCSRYNGCWPELVHDGKNGWVFDPLDEEDTVRALRLAFVAKNYKCMAQESRQIIANHTPKHAASAIYQACQIAVNR